MLLKLNTLLPILILFLVLISTVSGVFYQTPGSRIEYVTVRGERATFQGSGLYRYDPVSLAREGIIWDAINLFIGAPLLAAAIYLSAHNSLRGRMLLAGLSFYFIYVYLMYATMVAFNPLFLVYVAIFALSGVTLAVTLTQGAMQFRNCVAPAKFPRLLFIGFTIVMSASLIMLWLGRIIPLMAADKFPDEWAGMATLEAQALDLGMVVPLLVATGVALWRRSACGYLLTAITLTHGFMMFLTIPAWIVIPLIQDGKINLVEASPFLILCLVGLYLVVKFYSSVNESPLSSSP